MPNHTGLAKATMLAMALYSFWLNLLAQNAFLQGLSLIWFGHNNHLTRSGTGMLLFQSIYNAPTFGFFLLGFGIGITLLFVRSRKTLTSTHLCSWLLITYLITATLAVTFYFSSSPSARDVYHQLIRDCFALWPLKFETDSGLTVPWIRLLTASSLLLILGGSIFLKSKFPTPLTLYWFLILCGSPLLWIKPLIAVSAYQWLGDTRSDLYREFLHYTWLPLFLIPLVLISRFGATLTFSNWLFAFFNSSSRRAQES